PAGLTSCKTHTSKERNASTEPSRNTESMLKSIELPRVAVVKRSATAQPADSLADCLSALLDSADLGGELDRDVGLEESRLHVARALGDADDPADKRTGRRSAVWIG